MCSQKALIEFALMPPELPASNWRPTSQPWPVFRSCTLTSHTSLLPRLAAVKGDLRLCDPPNSHPHSLPAVRWDEHTALGASGPVVSDRAVMHRAVVAVALARGATRICCSISLINHRQRWQPAAVAKLAVIPHGEEDLLNVGIAPPCGLRTTVAARRRRHEAEHERIEEAATSITAEVVNIVPEHIAYHVRRTRDGVVGKTGVDRLLFGLLVALPIGGGDGGEGCQQGSTSHAGRHVDRWFEAAAGTRLSVSANAELISRRRHCHL